MKKKGLRSAHTTFSLAIVGHLEYSVTHSIFNDIQ